VLGGAGHAEAADEDRQGFDHECGIAGADPAGSLAAVDDGGDHVRPFAVDGGEVRAGACGGGCTRAALEPERPRSWELRVDYGMDACEVAEHADGVGGVVEVAGLGDDVE